MLNNNFNLLTGRIHKILIIQGWVSWVSLYLFKDEVLMYVLYFIIRLDVKITYQKIIISPFFRRSSFEWFMIIHPLIVGVV
jgi:hypothetical protein